MIETIQVIRCDAPYRTSQCSRFFPARGGLAQAWRAAVKRGWANAATPEAPKHLCPDHAKELS